jgi:hypothetical protein
LQHLVRPHTVVLVQAGVLVGTGGVAVPVEVDRQRQLLCPAAHSTATIPPSECPTTAGRSDPSVSTTAATSSMTSSQVQGATGVPPEDDSHTIGSREEAALSSTTPADQGPADRRPIGFWLKLVDRLIDAVLGDAGLTRRHWQVLNLLQTQPATLQRIDTRLAPFLRGP